MIPLPSPLPADYEPCGDCGFDHEYEFEEAVREHTRAHAAHDPHAYLARAQAEVSP